MSDPPTNIRALQAEQILEVTWPEGSVDRFRYRLLLAECPCATCRNEWTGERVLDPHSIRPDLKLESMENIGTYAIQLGWNDGFWNWAAGLDLNTLGFVIVGLFVATWLGAIAYWHWGNVEERWSAPLQPELD